MPSVRTHDAVTVLSAVPTAAVAWHFSSDPILVALTTSAMLFGGYMFGPDLDTVSRPYRRWGPLRIIWLPYRRAMPHRSRYSHGLLLGTAIRVVYFSAVVVLAGTLALVATDVYLFDFPVTPSMIAVSAGRVWAAISGIRPDVAVAVFAGLWIGAAVHTLTDIVGSTLKQIWQAL